MSCTDGLTAWWRCPKIFCIFRYVTLKDAIWLGFLGKEVLLVVRVVQTHLVASLLGPGIRVAKPTADIGRLGSVKILRVAHCIAVGILIMQVSARSWIQGLIVIDRILHRTCRPFGNRLVYVFRYREECVIYVVFNQSTGWV